MLTGSFWFRNTNWMLYSSILVLTSYRQKGPIIPVGLLRSWSMLLLLLEQSCLFIKSPTMRWKTLFLLPGLVPALLLCRPIRRMIVQQVLWLRFLEFPWIRSTQPSSCIRIKWYVGLRLWRQSIPKWSQDLSRLSVHRYCPPTTPIFRLNEIFDETSDELTLGAKGHLSRGDIEVTLRFFKQFIHTLPRG